MNAFQPPAIPMRPGDAPIDSRVRPLLTRTGGVANLSSRSRQGSNPQTARTLVTIYNGGSIPTQPDHVFFGYVTDIDADDVEGAIPTFAQDTNQTIPTVVLNGAAVAGDILVATFAGGRWIAEKTGQQKQYAMCRWWCGPYIQFALPAGSGGACSAATAALAVASDGTISGAKIVSPGSCYNVAHPSAIVVAQGGGSGAKLLATVGQVVTLTLTNGGSGYNPAAPPTVLIGPAGPGGTTAMATAQVAPNGVISGLTLTNPGALYQNATPTVSIAAPPAGGVQATATAVAKPGVVTDIKVTAPGSGYVSNIPPPYYNLTVSCAAWTLHFTLVSGTVNLGTAPAPAGTLPFCAAYGGTAVLAACPNGVCGTLPNVTFQAAVGVPQNFTTPQLLVNAEVAVQTAGPPDQQRWTGCFVPGSAGSFGSGTGGGPFGPQTIGCASGRPFSQSLDFDYVPAEGTITGTNSAETWFVLGGGSYPQILFAGQYLIADLNHPNGSFQATFTLSEPAP